MSHKTITIASVSKIQLGLDRSNLKLDYDTTKIHFPSFLSY